MNLQQLKKEIEALGKSPSAEKMYPITSNWVPISDVLAIINRFEKYWRGYKTPSDGEGRNLLAEILGQ
jgi:hypothetical protein